MWVYGHVGIARSDLAVRAVQLINYFGPRRHELTKELVNDLLINNPPSIIGFDIETMSLELPMPIGFSIAVNTEEAFYFRTYPEVEPEIEWALPLLKNPAILKVIHNSLFDLRNFPLTGFEIDRTNISDTMVMARLLGEQYTGLGDLAYMTGRIPGPSAREMMKGKQTMLEIPFEVVSEHCADDARICLALHYCMYDRMIEWVGKDYWQVEMDVVPILIDMGLRGLKVNQHDRAGFEYKYEAEMEYYSDLAKELCGDDFKPGSSQQVGFMLAKRGSFLPLTKSHKQLASGKGKLEFLDDPLATIILQFRHYRTALSTFIIPLDGIERAYTYYGMDISVGRLSSSGKDMYAHINMQNIPKELRVMYEPDSDRFTTGDFSQEHLRIIAHMSGDRQMRRVFEDGEMDGDIHSFFARELNIPRAFAKTINFAIPYGGTPQTVREKTKINDLAICAKFLDRWKDVFRDAGGWMDSVKRHGMADRWAVETLFGRKIKIQEEYPEGMERKCINYPVLGSDGEIMKRALIACVGAGITPAVSVHDSITVDGYCEFPVVELENLSDVHIPFDIKESARWE